MLPRRLVCIYHKSQKDCPVRKMRTKKMHFSLKITPAFCVLDIKYRTGLLYYQKVRFFLINMHFFESYPSDQTNFFGMGSNIYPSYAPKHHINVKLRHDESPKRDYFRITPINQSIIYKKSINQSYIKKQASYTPNLYKHLSDERCDLEFGGIDFDPV